MEQLQQLANELRSLQNTCNEGRGVQSARDVVMFLEKGDLESAKELCFSEADKLGSYPAITLFIIEKLFASGEENPWSVIERIDHCYEV